MNLSTLRRLMWWKRKRSYLFHFLLMGNVPLYVTVKFELERLDFAGVKKAEAFAREGFKREPATLSITPLDEYHYGT